MNNNMKKAMTSQTIKKSDILKSKAHKNIIVQGENEFKKLIQKEN